MSIIGKLTRGTLWVAAPPVGIYSSVRHGIRQHEKRQARLIGEEIRRQPTAIDLELERMKQEMGK